MDKIIKVNFEEGWKTQFNNSLTQEDFGLHLQIEGITLPDGNVEVHFSLTEHNGEALVSIGTVKDNVITVEIPDFILAKENVNNSSYKAYAWIYVTDGESGRTIRKIVFTINTRAESTTNVPEDQKDQFLQEVRSIMQETKDIAQSVRDDADNGVFNGVQGPKGDAGSIEFKIVNELPTENISESTMYLVPLSPGTEQNEFAEYIYANGHWEYIGSASVEVDLSEYVKKTDYASNNNFGVVKTNSKYGIQTANGVLFIKRATDGEIDLREQQWAVITPKNLDYAVKKALSDCKLTGDDVWTEEEKSKALELLGGVDKKYVDDLVGSVESILTELHAHAESLIGGEA